ncbi:MAG: hypothetical protein GEU93_05125 [Propionibacteriales bacterium]|nr:hypothetical protein [Propionibacteriales bacterium]
MTAPTPDADPAHWGSGATWSPHRDEPPVTWPQAIVAVLVTAVVFLAGGALSAGIWSWVAESPTYPVNYAVIGDQPYPDVHGMLATFNVDGTFLIVGGVAAVVLGWCCAAMFRGYGVVAVVAVLLGSAVGYLVMRHLGLELGPEPLEAQAAAAEPGDVLHGRLEVQATGVYFGWPAGALAGAMVALTMWAPRPPAARS